MKNKIRKDKSDLSIETIRLLSSYSPISREMCALILTYTEELNIKLNPGSFVLKRAWNSLENRGHIETYGNRNRPDEHYAKILPRVYNFNPPIPQAKATIIEKLKEMAGQKHGRKGGKIIKTEEKNPVDGDALNSAH